jgi:all-trans-retinol 13,14-reductase
MKLLPDNVVPRSIQSTFEQIGHSVSFFYIFIGMEGSPTELQLRSSNIWHWPQRDYDKMLKEFYADPLNAPLPLFIGFPCAKDSTWSERFPGKSNAVIMTVQKHEWWEQWQDKRQGHRGAEYEELKRKIGDRILEEGLYHYYPQTRGKVTFTMTGSSLTFNHYIGSERGEVYGLDSAPLRFQQGAHQSWLRPQLPGIKGAFQTGVDVTTLGVTGALMAGVLTAHEVLGYGSLADLLSGRNLVEDLWHLDAQSNGSR